MSKMWFREMRRKAVVPSATISFLQLHLCLSLFLRIIYICVCFCVCVCGYMCVYVCAWVHVCTLVHVYVLMCTRLCLNIFSHRLHGPGVYYLVLCLSVLMYMEEGSDFLVCVWIPTHGLRQEFPIFMLWYWYILYFYMYCLQFK